MKKQEPKVTYSSIDDNCYYKVQIGRLVLDQHIINDIKFNSAYIIKEDGSTELIDHNHNRCQGLFIALHNYKVQNGHR